MNEIELREKLESLYSAIDNCRHMTEHGETITETIDDIIDNINSFCNKHGDKAWDINETIWNERNERTD